MQKLAVLGSLLLTLTGVSTLTNCVGQPPVVESDRASGNEPARENDPAAEAIPAVATIAAPVKEAPRVVVDEPPARTLKEQRDQLFRAMERELDLSPTELAAVKKIALASPFLGQGNPSITKHPMSRAECRQIRADAGLNAEPAAKSEAHAPCKRANMVPIYDAESGETAKDAKVCIDQFEFPNIPCEYPVVFTSAREAALICSAEGKRICDAHEWEGACAGDLKPAAQEYAWDKARPAATAAHNKDREKRWAYGPEKNHPICATGSFKTPGCPGGGYGDCGSNTYPAGAFPLCVSTFGVYDQHGNAAEHMNLPLNPSELASQGGTGSTEMKGSWFVFQKNDAHEDDCHWRAKDWHPSKLMSEESHSNYHLGFRCCSDVDEGA